MDFSLAEEQELLLVFAELITTNFPESISAPAIKTGHTRVSLCGHWRIAVFPCAAEEFGSILRVTSPQMLALMQCQMRAPAFLITNSQCIHSMRRFGSADSFVKRRST